MTTRTTQQIDAILLREHVREYHVTFPEGSWLRFTREEMAIRNWILMIAANGSGSFSGPGGIVEAKIIWEIDRPRRPGDTRHLLARTVYG